MANEGRLWTVMAGNPHRGYTLHGQFDHHEDAFDWATTQPEAAIYPHWVVVPIEPVLLN